MQEQEIIQLQSYLRKKFANATLTVRARKIDDSAEVYSGKEFLGVLYRDDEDPKDISYNFDMAILAQDLLSLA